MRRKSILLTLGLFTSLLSAPLQSASALSVKSVPAPWIYTYAGGASTSIQKQPQAPSANLEKKSNFVIDFNNVPANAKPAIQAAVDTWSENFASKIDIKVNITWARASNVGVLAAASSVSNFAFPECSLSRWEATMANDWTSRMAFAAMVGNPEIAWIPFETVTFCHQMIS